MQPRRKKKKWRDALVTLFWLRVPVIGRIVGAALFLRSQFLIGVIE